MKTHSKKILSKSAPFLDRNIFILNISSFLWGLIFPFAVIVPFLMHYGYEAKHFFYLKAIFSLSVILFEVPAGFISDFLGRKKTLILSYFLSAVTMLFYGMGSCMIQFVLAEIMWAISLSLYSGTDSAFYFETIKAKNKSKDFKKIYGNSVFLKLIALSLANILSGFLAKKSFFIPFFLSFLAFTAGGVICFFLKENKNKSSANLKNNWQIFLLTINKISKENTLKLQVFFASLLGAFSFVFFRLGQPFLVDINIPIEFFGIILSLQKIISALSAKFSYFFEEKLKEKLFLFLTLLLLLANFLVFAFFKNYLGVVFIIFAGVAYNFSIPWINEKINQRLDDNSIRASVVSLQNWLQKLFFVILGSLSGLLLSYINIPFLSLLMTFLLIILLFPLCGKILSSISCKN